MALARERTMTGPTGSILIEGLSRGDAQEGESTGSTIAKLTEVRLRELALERRKEPITF